MIKGSLFLLVFALPLIFDSSIFSAFSLPKLVLVRIITVVLVSVWIAESLAKGNLRVKRSSLSLPLFIFVIVVVVSTFNSVHPRTAVLGEYNVYEGSLALLSYALLCFAALNFVEGERDCRLLLTALLVSTTVVSVLGIFDYFRVNYYPGLGGLMADGFIRSSATFGNPVIFGGFLSLAFPLAVVLFAKGVFGRSFRWLAAISLSTMFPALLFTGSRGAWAGVGVGLVFVLALVGRDFFRDRRLAVVSGAVALTLIVGSMAAVSGSSYLRGRALSLFHPRAEGSIGDRLQIWRTTMPIIADYPVLGTGPDTLGLVFARFKAPAYARSETEKAVTSKAHNEFLQAAATTGLLGLVAYLWIIVLAFWKGFKGVGKNLFLDRRGFPRLPTAEPQGDGGQETPPNNGTGKSRLSRSKADLSFCTEPFNSSANSFLRKSLLFALLAGFLSYFVQLQFSFSFIAVAPVFWMLLGVMFSLVEEENRVALEGRIDFPRWLRSKWKVIAMGLAVPALLLIGLSTRPWFADYRFTKAEDFRAAGAIEKAISEYEQAVSLNRTEETYWYSLGNAYLQKAQLYSSAGDFEFYLGKAIDSYDAAQELNPLDEASYYYAGYAYQIWGQRSRNTYLFAQAAEMNRKVLKLNPNSADGHLNLGAALASMGLIDQAISEWQRAKWLDPRRIDAHYNLGWAYERKGLRNKALLEFQSALRLDPDNMDVKRALEQLED